MLHDLPSQWFSHTNDKVGHTCQISYRKTATIQSIAHFLAKEHTIGFIDKNRETTDLPRKVITTYQTSVKIHKTPLLILITVKTLNIRMCYCLNLSQPYNRGLIRCNILLLTVQKSDPINIQYCKRCIPTISTCRCWISPVIIAGCCVVSCSTTITPSICFWSCSCNSGNKQVNTYNRYRHNIPMFSCNFVSYPTL